MVHSERSAVILGFPLLKHAAEVRKLDAGLRSQLRDYGRDRELGSTYAQAKCVTATLREPDNTVS